MLIDMKGRKVKYSKEKTDKEKDFILALNLLIKNTEGFHLFYTKDSIDYKISNMDLEKTLILNELLNEEVLREKVFNLLDDYLIYEDEETYIENSDLEDIDLQQQWIEEIINELNHEK